MDTPWAEGDLETSEAQADILSCENLPLPPPPPPQPRGIRTSSHENTKDTGTGERCFVASEALEELAVSCPTDEARLRPQQDFCLESQQEPKPPDEFSYFLFISNEWMLVYRAYSDIFTSQPQDLNRAHGLASIFLLITVKSGKTNLHVKMTVCPACQSLYPVNVLWIQIKA
ncbi:hypothetical protein E5288_WYG018610 [Bos mutus]|uniref:Uncharacterized protein n=1 Tax=Bos mutus TaxID=72004 RepID=A0A6B0R6U9_9CETA|nr:hypothetical protein [Bos mutus]